MTEFNISSIQLPLQTLLYLCFVSDTPTSEVPKVFPTHLSLTEPSDLQLLLFNPALGATLSWVTLSYPCHPVLTASVELKGCWWGWGCLLFLGYSKPRHQAPIASLQAAWPLSISSGLPICLIKQEGVALARLPARLLLSTSE